MHHQSDGLSIEKGGNDRTATSNRPESGRYEKGSCFRYTCGIQRWDLARGC